jgi:hypothetical protein
LENSNTTTTTTAILKINYVSLEILKRIYHLKDLDVDG